MGQGREPWELGPAWAAWGCVALCLLAPAHALAAPPDADADRQHGDSFAHVYLAQWSRTRFNQIVRLNTDFDSSWLVAVGVGGKWRDLGPHSRLEWEVQAARHWGEQHHLEISGIASIRWHAFPWDSAVRNTVALGTGPSYAFDVPAIEELGDDESTYLLEHLMLDVTAAPPARSPWELFLRVHHRSGVFGAVADSGSSNFVGFGIRRRY